VSRRRSIAIGAGLRHFYTGNVHDIEAGTIFCPGATAGWCGAAGMSSSWLLDNAARP
jgi:pyruvate formate lyase activating enzyme